MKYILFVSKILFNKRSRQFSRKLSTVSSKKWQSVVGLEVHAQLNTKSKLFSGAQNTFGGLVNNCVSLFDAAIPGTLPVLNRTCVELGILTALALSCKVNEISSFDRKHYFYADLPTGYQITQQRAPLASDGVINFQVFTPGIHKKPYIKSSKIKQIQLEQDSGKSLHDAELKRSLVDLNRAGAPLIELVFEPDLEDGEEAAALVKELVLIVQRLGACSGRMEEGALRVDANVSLRRVGDPLSTRTEAACDWTIMMDTYEKQYRIPEDIVVSSSRPDIFLYSRQLKRVILVELTVPWETNIPKDHTFKIKNIGSVRGVAGAIRHEIERQQSILDNGGRIINETRSWDATAKVTIPMRDKEVVQDYRYMPEPNLPPLRVNLSTKEDSPDIISVPSIYDKIPELPEESRTKLINKFNLRPEIAIQLVNEPMLLDLFKNITSNCNKNPTKVANLLVNELLTVLNKRKVEIDYCPITVKHLLDLIDLLLQNKINLDVCRKTFDQLIDEPVLSVEEIIEQNAWLLVSDEQEIANKCLEIIDNNPKLVTKYKEGKIKVFKALLGLLAKDTNNKLDMSLASKKMEELLKKS